MNKKGNVGMFFGFIALFIILILFGYLMNIATNNQTQKDCNKYREDYKIMTQTQGEFYKWDESYKCVVLMKDGTKVDLRDFNIATIKEPIVV